MSENVYVVQPVDFDQNPRYEIKIGKSLESILVPDCVIRFQEIPGIKTHKLIIAYHQLGGGIHGWDDYEENLELIDNSEISNDQLVYHTNQYAEKIAQRLNYRFFDLDKTKKIQDTMREIQERKNYLQELTA